MKKIFVTMFSTLFLGLTFLVPNTFANEIEEVVLANEFNNASIKELNKQSYDYKNKIQELSDEEFDRFIFNVVSDNNKDIKELEKNLELVGVELNMNDTNSLITPFEIRPSQMTLQAYATKRSGDNFWRLQSQWTTGRTELYEASHDVVSIEWDPSVASYYDAAVPSGNIVTKRDGSNRANGIYLFNVDDRLYFDSYATVYVTKKSNSALHFGTKYVHTYSEVNSTFSLSANVNYQKGSPSGGATFTVNTQTNEASWPLWEDNILYW